MRRPKVRGREEDEDVVEECKRRSSDKDVEDVVEEWKRRSGDVG
jgi:hypothetical protein